MADCSRQIVPSNSNPAGVPKTGDVLVFNIVPPIVYPCHEKVIVVRGADLQQESGNSFQVKLTADQAQVDVIIWCNALLGDGETEGGKVCETTYPLLLGKAKLGYYDCLKKCLTDLVPWFLEGSIFFAALGVLYGFLVGGPVGAIIGGYGGVLFPFVTGGLFCAIKCFFETL